MFRTFLLPAMLAFSAAAGRCLAQAPAIFQAEKPLSDRWQYASPVAIDFNQDGFLDLVAVGMDSASGRTLATFVNDGTGGWSVARTQWDDRKISPSSKPHFGNLDGDGRLDLFAMEAGNPSWCLLDFPSDGARSVPGTGLLLIDSLYKRLPPTASALYGQGIFGFVTWFDVSSGTRQYFQWSDFDATFSDLLQAQSERLSTPLIQADFNMDGKPDAVAFPGYASSQDSAVYRRSSPGGYEDTRFPAFGMWSGSQEVGDYDNDGDLDIVSTGMTMRGAAFGNVNFRGFFENRDGNFHLTEFDRDGPGYGASLLADLDNDGDLDMVSMGKYVQTQVHRNVSTRKNERPSVPGGLTVTAGPDSVLLRWQPSQDDLTPSPGLTYNLRVGTRPELGDILEAAADPATGRLRIPHRGNVGSSTSSYFFTESRKSVSLPLVSGTYYWTVQAVDNGYAASAFAPVQAFEIDGSTVSLLDPKKSGRKTSQASRLRPGRRRGALSLDGRESP